MNAHVPGPLMTDAELAAHDEALIDVLCSSLYPGAARDSARLVLGYCRAAGLDPMQKPVHIVPMTVKTGGRNKYDEDEYAKRDTIMPGIGLYRVQAARTGQYAGQDVPEFGPMVEFTYTARRREWVSVQGRDKKQPRDVFVEKTLRHPEWCAVTVYRLVGGFRVSFVAVEYWVENYATAGRDSEAPNEMWERRVRGQLAKCAEAQALRKAFPEVGAQPTAEEMEGRAFDMDEQPPEAPEVKLAGPRRASEAAAAEPVDAVVKERPTEPEPEPEPPPVGKVATEPAAAAPAPVPAAAEPQPSKVATAPAAAPAQGEPASEGERKNVIVTAKARGYTLADILADEGLTLDPETLVGLTKPQFKAIKARLQ